MKIIIVCPDVKKSFGPISERVRDLKLFPYHDMKLVAYASCHNEGYDIGKAYHFYRLALFPFIVRSYHIVELHTTADSNLFYIFKYLKIAKHFDKKVVLYIHESNHLNFFEGMSEKKKDIIKKNLHNVDMVLVSSEKIKEDLEDFFDFTESKVAPTLNNEERFEIIHQNYTNLNDGLYVNSFKVIS